MKNLHGPEVGEVCDGSGFWEPSREAGTDLVVEDYWDRVGVCQSAMAEEVIVRKARTAVDDD